MDVIECIKERRSIRKYTSQKISNEIKNLLLSTAICAPSGKNGQPWRFKYIDDEKQIKAISQFSIYRSWMQTAPLLIAIFLDRENSYNYVKDVQSCGAAIQNMLLAAKSVGIGSCWIGEILSKENEVKKLLAIENEKLQLMGIVAFGYVDGEVVNVGRKEIDEFII